MEWRIVDYPVLGVSDPGSALLGDAEAPAWEHIELVSETRTLRVFVGRGSTGLDAEVELRKPKSMVQIRGGTPLVWDGIHAPYLVESCSQGYGSLLASPAGDRLALWNDIELAVLSEGSTRYWRNLVIDDLTVLRFDGSVLHCRGSRHIPGELESFEVRLDNLDGP